MSVERFKEDVTYEVNASTANLLPLIFSSYRERFREGSIQWPPFISELAEKVGTEGGRLIGALIPRYELALAERRSNKRLLEQAMRSGIDDYFARALTGAVTLQLSAANLAHAENMLHLHRVILHGRLDHELRGIEGKPRKKWHERHPVIYAITLLLIGGAVKIGFDVAKALIAPDPAGRSSVGSAPAFSPPDAQRQLRVG